MLSRNNHEMIISQSMPLIILLPKDRKIEKSLICFQYLCIDCRVFSARLYKRETKTEQATKKNSETFGMHFNFSWNWILKF